MAGLAIVGVGALVIGVLSQDDTDPCEEWQERYVTMLEDVMADMRDGSLDVPGAEIDSQAADLESSQPENCPTPLMADVDEPVDSTTTPRTSPTSPTSPTPEAPLPTTIPLVARTGSSRFTVTGFRADLVDHEVLGPSYVATVDFQWVGPGKPEENILCDFRFLNVEGLSIFQRDEVLGFYDIAYIDDWPFAHSLKVLKPYFREEGAPAAATVDCDKDPRYE